MGVVRGRQISPHKVEMTKENKERTANFSKMTCPSTKGVSRGGGRWKSRGEKKISLHRVNTI